MRRREHEAAKKTNALRVAVSGHTDYFTRMILVLVFVLRPLFTDVLTRIFPELVTLAVDFTRILRVCAISNSQKDRSQMVNNKIRLLIKENRLKLNISQQELADMAGVTKRSIAYWESGKKKFRWNVQIK